MSEGLQEYSMATYCNFTTKIGATPNKGPTKFIRWVDSKMFGKCPIQGSVRTCQDIWYGLKLVVTEKVKF